MNQDEKDDLDRTLNIPEGEPDWIEELQGEIMLTITGNTKRDLNWLKDNVAFILGVRMGQISRLKEQIEVLKVRLERANSD